MKKYVKPMMKMETLAQEMVIYTSGCGSNMCFSDESGCGTDTCGSNTSSSGGFCDCDAACPSDES